MTLTPLWNAARHPLARASLQAPPSADSADHHVSATLFVPPSRSPVSLHAAASETHKHVTHVCVRVLGLGDTAPFFWAGVWFTKYHFQFE